MQQTKQVTTAVCTMLWQWGMPAVTEYVLPNGRRLDVAHVGKNGALLGVEVKISTSDFNRDGKWADAMRQCFIFYFAVPHGFPVEIIHPGIRVITVRDGVAKITRRTGRGLCSPHEWHKAAGRYAVNPTAGVDPSLGDAPGDRTRGGLWMP
jgi:hypothetical protein